MEGAKSEPTNTDVEAEGREGDESGEAEAAVAPEEEKTTKAQVRRYGGVNI